MNKSVVLAIVSGILLAGCGKKEEAAKEAPPPLPTLPYMNESKDGAPKAPDAPAAPAEPAPAQTENTSEKSAEEGFPAETLNAAIQSFIEQFERPPASLQELVEKQVLRKMPVPPAGKKFVYDTTRRKVMIVNK